MGCSVRKYSHFVAPSGKLRLARFSAELEIFQMGPSVAIQWWGYEIMGLLGSKTYKNSVQSNCGIYGKTQCFLSLKFS